MTGIVLGGCGWPELTETSPAMTRWPGCTVRRTGVIGMDRQVSSWYMASAGPGPELTFSTPGLLARAQAGVEKEDKELAGPLGVSTSHYPPIPTSRLTGSKGGHPGRKPGSTSAHRCLQSPAIGHLPGHQHRLQMPPGDRVGGHVKKRGGWLGLLLAYLAGSCLSRRNDTRS